MNLLRAIRQFPENRKIYQNYHFATRKQLLRQFISDMHYEIGASKTVPEYSIEIYHCCGQYVFTAGWAHLYVSGLKYGNGWGVSLYLEPICALPETDADALAVFGAVQRCREVLEENRVRMARECREIMYGDMESILLKNFKLIGIRTSQRKITHEPILHLSVLQNKSVIAVFQTTTHRESVTLEEQTFPPSVPLEVLCAHTAQLLQKFPERVEIY